MSTLNVLLSHEDIVSFILKPDQESSKSVYLHMFCDGEVFKNNNLFSTLQNCLEIILYHDDFGTVNPLGNKVSKYKISAFYFLIGNIPSKFRSRLNDISLLLISLASIIQKYGHSQILQPCLDDLCKLETMGIKVNFENNTYLFKGGGVNGCC